MTAVSTVTLVTTGKSITDHAATTVTQNDCDGYRLLTGKQDYYCERVKEPGTTYNRNPY